MKIRRSGRGQSITVTIGKKTEKHSLAELPAFTSLAVEDEMQAFQYELDLPFTAHLLKNSEWLLFLAYIALHEKGGKVDGYDLLELLSRFRREHTHIIREIGSRADQSAAHLRDAFVHLSECEEERAFDAMQACMRTARDMRMFAKEGQESFQCMEEMTTELLEQLTGLKLEIGPAGRFTSISSYELSMLPREYAELCNFLTDQDGVRILRKHSQDNVREARDQQHDFHITKEMEKAEKRGEWLGVMPLIFRDFCATVAPAAAAVTDAGHDIRHVQQILEQLEHFNDCLSVRLKSVAEYGLRIHPTAAGGKHEQLAIRSLAAAIPLFRQIADVMQDLYEFCDELDDGYYLSLLPRYRVEAMLHKAQDRSVEERKKRYVSLPVVRDAFLSITRMRAIAKLCDAYCAAHEQMLPEKDSLKALSVMSEDERNAINLSAVLGISLFETVSLAETKHKRLQERAAQILAALAPERDAVRAARQ